MIQLNWDRTAKRLFINDLRLLLKDFGLESSEMMWTSMRHLRFRNSESLRLNVNVL